MLNSLGGRKIESPKICTPSVKNNLSKEPESLVYSVEEAENEIGRIVWHGTSRFTADASCVNRRRRKRKTSCVNFLLRPATDIQTEAEARGIAKRTLRPDRLGDSICFEIPQARLRLKAETSQPRLRRRHHIFRDSRRAEPEVL
jgi:hypothetical protein